MVKLKTNKLKKKHVIKLPEDIKVIYCSNKNILIFNKLSYKKFLKLDVKIVLNSSKNLILVTDIPVTSGKKNFKKLQGTTVANIKHLLIEISYILFVKLVLVGVGYRVFPYQKMDNQVYFKLGYSHMVYFKVPLQFSIFCSKSIKIFLYGNSSYKELTQVASQIRSFKVPEIYKGKGILYYQEEIKLKKGKKV